MELVKPWPLRPGDRIGIVATSSPVTASELDRLAARLINPGVRGAGS
jgi:muramoyltetrapeptide carboxypeptidase LdcA involved in peptidoglycan recycling